MTYPDPILAFGSTLVGLLLLVPFLWLPAWTMWFGMAATAAVYGITAYRRGIVFTPVEMLCIVVFWPVAIGVVVIIKVRKWNRRRSSG